MGHRERLAKLMAAGKSNTAVVLKCLKGMTTEEALRLWFGSDRTSWPPADADFILIVPGLDMPYLARRLDDIPDDFMEHRDGLMFETRWKRFCDFFDGHRRQVQEKNGVGLMVQTKNAGIYKTLYGCTDIPFEAPASPLN